MLSVHGDATSRKSPQPRTPSATKRPGSHNLEPELAAGIVTNESVCDLGLGERTPSSHPGRRMEASFAALDPKEMRSCPSFTLPAPRRTVPSPSEKPTSRR